jgi:uncharacterized protein (TIGR04255 family)
MILETKPKTHISEVICGVTLKEPVLGKAGYIFELVNTLKPDYPVIRYANPLADGELKDFVLETSLNHDQTGHILYQLNTNDLHWLVQIQFNKFFHSWVRRNDEDVGSYPGYTEIYKKFSLLKTLIHDISKTELAVKFYELTYQDRIFWQNYICDLSEVDRILKIKMPVIKTGNRIYSPNNIFSKCTIPIDKVGGFALVSVNTATAKNNRQIISFQCTIRGLNEHLTVNEWYETAHVIQIDLFNDFFDQKVQQTVGNKFLR